MWTPLAGAVGANLIANGLTNGLGQSQTPAASFSYNVADELQPQIQGPAFMPLMTMPGLAGIASAAATPAAAPAAVVVPCDSCSGKAAQGYAGQLSGPMLWAAVGALAGWAGDRGAVKGAVAGYLAALLLGAK